MLRLAERDHDLTLTVLSAETGIDKGTLATYKRDVAMPAWALVALCEFIPDDLTSLMFEPVGKHVGSGTVGDGDFDTAALAANDFAGEVVRARHPASPGGTAIVPQEAAVISDKGRRACAAMRRAA